MAGRETSKRRSRDGGVVLIAVLVGLTLLVGMASVVWVVAMRNVEVLEGVTFFSDRKLSHKGSVIFHGSQPL